MVARIKFFNYLDNCMKRVTQFTILSANNRGDHI